MNWSLLIVVFVIMLIILVVSYILHDKVVSRDKHCINCRKKTFDDWFEIRCKNKRSKQYGTMVDDYAVCDRWRG